MGKTLQSGNLTLDTSIRKVFLDEQELRLSDMEFDVLAALMEHPGQVVARQWLFENIVGGEELRLVDRYIRWLRDKTAPTLSSPLRISIVRGIGYRFDG